MKHKEKVQKPFECGSKVQWNFRGHKVQGIVQKIFLKRIEKQFRGATFVRLGSVTKPAYQVKTISGKDVLKSHTELKSLRV